MQHLCRQVHDSLWFAADGDTVVEDSRWPKAALHLDLTPPAVAAAAAAAAAADRAAGGAAEVPATQGAGARSARAAGQASEGGGAGGAERAVAEAGREGLGREAAADLEGAAGEAELCVLEGGRGRHAADPLLGLDTGEQQLQQSGALMVKHLRLLLHALLQLRFREPAGGGLGSDVGAACGAEGSCTLASGAGMAGGGGGGGGGGGWDGVDGRADSDGGGVGVEPRMLVVPLESLVLHGSHIGGSGSGASAGANAIVRGHDGADGTAPSAAPAAAAADGGAGGVGAAVRVGCDVEDDYVEAVTDELVRDVLVWGLTGLSGSVRLRHLELCHSQGLTVGEWCSVGGGDLSGRGVRGLYVLAGGACHSQGLTVGEFWQPNCDQADRGLGVRG